MEFAAHTIKHRRTLVATACIAVVLTRAVLRRYRRRGCASSNTLPWSEVPNMVRFFASPSKRHERISSWIKMYGGADDKTVTFSRFFLTANRDLVSLALNDTENFPARPTLGAAFFIPFSVLTLPSNSMWKEHRATLAPLFTDQYLASYLGDMTPIIAKLVSRYRAGGRTEHTVHDMADVTLDILGQCVLGEELGSMDQTTEQRLQRASETRLKLRSTTFLTPLPKWMWPIVPFPGRWTFRGVLQRRLQHLRALLQRAATAARAGVVRNTMLDFIARKELASGRVWSEREKTSELEAFIMAGHETTANTLSFALHLLSLHPDVQQKMRDEYKAVVGADSNLESITFETLSRLSYTWAVFRETLRLYPTVPMNIREAAKDCRLGPYHVEKGTMVVLSNILLGTDTTLFPDADKFMPERWIGIENPFQDVQNFGGGLRTCIGKRFAEEEGVLVLYAIVSSFRVEPDHPTPEMMLETDFSVTQTLSNPLKMRFVSVK
eukprot:PhM_4_TR10047/c3_g1_i2/m.65767